jgi:hypothetical protein
VSRDVDGETLGECPEFYLPSAVRAAVRGRV